MSGKKKTQTPEHSQIPISSSPEFALWFPHESEEKQGVGRGEKRRFQSPVQSQPPLFRSQHPSSKTFVSSGSVRKPFQTLSCSERAAGRAEHAEINSEKGEIIVVVPQNTSWGAIIIIS